MPPEVLEFLTAELGFFDKVTDISGALYSVPKDERKGGAVRLAREVGSQLPVVLAPRRSWMVGCHTHSQSVSAHVTSISLTLGACIGVCLEVKTSAYQSFDVHRTVSATARVTAQIL